jgi:hypothetical protein
MLAKFKNLSVTWKIVVVLFLVGIVFSVVQPKPSIHDYVDAAIEQGEKQERLEKAFEAGIIDHLNK